ncbi:MAG: hypothetical protein WC894_01850 [Patescibacteria group bacterium]
MRKFHVYIIESPNAVDLYHKRFEGESLQKTLKLSGIESSHRLTVNLESFRAAFYVGLKEYFESNSVQPIIHISAHGNSEGIELTSKEKVNWKDLKLLLKPINKVLNGKLLVSLSSCNGSSGCRMSMHDDDFPFLAVIGNKSSPKWSETNIAYATFYHLFHNDKSLYNCVEAMKTASGNNNFQLISSKIARQSYVDIIKRNSAVNTMERNIPQNQSNNLTKALTK